MLKGRGACCINVTEKYVAAVGAANLDLHGRSKKAIVMRDSNPGRLHSSAGGVTRNIAENLARQGVAAKLFTAVGGDVYAEKILRDSAAAGIDVSAVLRVPGESSSCYMAVLDESGDMLIGMSDMTVLSRVTPGYLEENRDALAGAAAVVCDSCLRPETLEYICSLPVPVFLDPVSTAYSLTAKPFAGSLYCIKPNRMELAVLSGAETDSDDGIIRASDILLERGLRCVCVSMGARGCYWADRDGRRMFRSLRPLTVMENATGAGDAFMSGLVHGFTDGADIGECLDYALACGIIAARSPDTISAEMSDALVRRTVKEFSL